MVRRLSISLSVIALTFGAALVACSKAPLDTDESDQPVVQTPQSPAPPATTVDEADASVEAAAACVTVAPNNKCGLDPQCGCGTDETCDVTNQTSGATSCVTAGSATVGRPCEGTGDCIQGLACVYGACRPYCSSPLSKCTVAGTDLCVTIPDDTTNVPIPNMDVCTIACDPREPTGVCGTNACLWFDTYYAPNLVSDCNFGGTTQPLDDCDDASDCQPGYTCAQNDRLGGMVCEEWCRIGVAGDCGTDTKHFKCTDLYGANAPVIGGVKEGVCDYSDN